MDLNSLNVSAAADKGAAMQVKHPSTGINIEGMTVTLLGTDSKKYRDSIKTRARKFKRDQVIDFDQSEVDECETLANITLGWTGFDEDGKAIEFTKANAQRIYLQHVWLREQVGAFISDRSNFLKA